MRLAVGLDGAGWHPAAWREPGARPSELLTRGLVPRLREPGVFRRDYAATTLRGLLGLTRPAGRYTAARQGEPG